MISVIKEVYVNYVTKNMIKTKTIRLFIFEIIFVFFYLSATDMLKI